MSSFHSAAVKNVASTALPCAVADDVVVEVPLVLGPLAAGERALEELQAVDGERATLAEQRVPLGRVQRGRGAVVLERQRRRVGARDLGMPAPQPPHRRARARPGPGGERVHQVAHVIERVVQRHRRAHTRLVHRHGREHGEVGVEAVGHHARDHVVRDRGQTPAACSGSALRRASERIMHSSAELGEPLDALPQCRLHAR